MDSILRIHVAGVPSRVKQSELLHFFESFGPIVSVEPRPCKEDITISPGKSSKTYWVLRLANEDTYLRILSEKQVVLFGRSIHVSPMFSGRDLIMHNRENTKKRVLIKKVPSWVTEEQLLSAIESQIGKVEAYFKYETDSHKAKKHDSKKKIRKVCTYSVTMQEKSDRDQLIALGQLKLTAEISVPVEKYISLRMQAPSNNSSIPTQPPRLSAKPSEYSSLQVKVPEFKRNRDDRNSFSQSTHFGASPALEKPPELPDLFYFGDSREAPLLVPEHLKPTQKRYHCFHQNRFSAIKPAFEEESNLRFNAVAGSPRVL